MIKFDVLVESCDFKKFSSRFVEFLVAKSWSRGVDRLEIFLRSKLVLRSLDVEIQLAF